jgi:hypothetical protein
VSERVCCAGEVLEAVTPVAPASRVTFPLRVEAFGKSYRAHGVQRTMRPTSPVIGRVGLRSVPDMPDFYGNENGHSRSGRNVFSKVRNSSCTTLTERICRERLAIRPIA